MTERVFVDSNIVVYAHTVNDKAKHCQHYERHYDGIILVEIRADMLCESTALVQ